MAKNTTYWVKKNGGELFDVALESYGGAEIGDLVSLHILDKHLERK